MSANSRVAIRTVPSTFQHIKGDAQLTTRQNWQVGLSVLVLGSLLGLAFYSAITDLDVGVRAPLYALIAATGFAVVLGPRSNQRWQKGLNVFVRVAAILAAVLSAYNWLLSEDAGTGIELVGAVGAAVAAIAFMVNLYDGEALIESQEPHDGESD